VINGGFAARPGGGTATSEGGSRATPPHLDEQRRHAESGCGEWTRKATSGRLTVGSDERRCARARGLSCSRDQRAMVAVCDHTRASGLADRSTLNWLINIDESLRRGLDGVLPPGTTSPRCMRSVAMVAFDLTLTIRCPRLARDGAAQLRGRVRSRGPLAFEPGGSWRLPSAMSTRAGRGSSTRQQLYKIDRGGDPPTGLGRLPRVPPRPGKQHYRPAQGGVKNFLYRRAITDLLVWDARRSSQPAAAWHARG
jgi:hypothetical protein